MAEVSLKIKKKDGTFLELDKSYLQSIESLTQLTSDPSSIQYGALPNSGSATAIDIDGEIKKAIENGTIDNSNLQAEFWMNGNRISSHIITDSDYTPDKVFSVQMTDNISKWDSTYSGRSLTESMTAYELLKEVLKTLPDNYSDDEIDNIILGNTIVYGETQTIGSISDFLKTITITYPYLNSDTYRNTFAKFCNLAQLQCFQDEDGYPVFINARPIFANNQEKAVHILTRAQRASLKSSVLLKNKIKSIQYSKTSTNLGYVSTGEIGFTFYNQSDKQRFATVTSITPSKEFTKILYGNNWDDYRGKTTTTNANTSFFDAYDDLHIIVKTRLKKTNKSKYDRWKIQFDNTNTNYYDEYYNLKSDSKPVLFNGIYNKFSALNFSWADTTFVSTQSEALQILNNNHGTICVIDYEDSLDIYYVARKGMEFVPEAKPSVYDGEIRIIFLNGTMNILLNSLIEETISEGNSDSDFSMQTNELFSTSTYINNDINIYDYIVSNIKSDYIGGIATASVELFCSNLYYQDGTLAKDWSKGEILNVGDIIYFDRDKYIDETQRYWKITSVKPKYDGEPLLDLELMEARKLPAYHYAWVNKIWNGLTNFYGDGIWTDGKNIYYSSGTDQYVLNKETDTWEPKTWSGLTSFYKSYIWNDGKKTHYSNGSRQYVLSGSVWIEENWYGASPDGNRIWTDGDNIYLSNGSQQYVLNKIARAWTEKTWNGLTNFYGDGIWTDGKNIYYSSGTNQYILNKDTSTWETKIWNGLTNFDSSNIWTDGENIYYSAGNIEEETQYILDVPTSTWRSKEWTGTILIYGSRIWTDGENIYYSDDLQQYILL